MVSRQRFSQAAWAAAAAAAAGGVGELVRRRRSASNPPAPPPPPPPLTTQSSPGQIADLQQTYGAEMGPAAGAPNRDGTEAG